MAQEVMGRPGIPDRILMMSSVSTCESYGATVLYLVSIVTHPELAQETNSRIESSLTHDGQRRAEVGLAAIGVGPSLQ